MAVGSAVGVGVGVGVLVRFGRAVGSGDGVLVRCGARSLPALIGSDERPIGWVAIRLAPYAAAAAITTPTSASTIQPAIVRFMPSPP